MTIRLAKKQNVSLEDTEASAPPLQQKPESADSHWHQKLEGKPVIFTVLVLLAVIIGGPVQYIPLAIVKSNVPTIEAVKPYTPLELEGRDIYVREGCYNCHSQMIRPFLDEIIRYGDYTKPGETIYDHPFQFGSKRTGPDLARVGGKYLHFWHYRHMLEPQSTTTGSIMPPYPWLFENELDVSLTQKKLSAMQTLGVPYSDKEVEMGVKNLNEQALKIVQELKSQGVGDVQDMEKKEIIALIAYLQRLGQDTRVQ